MKYWAPKNPEMAARFTQFILLILAIPFAAWMGVIADTGSPVADVGIGILLGVGFFVLSSIVLAFTALAVAQLYIWHEERSETRS